MNEGNFQVLITTGQFFGEGSDLQNIQCLFLVYPFSFEGKLIQYIGRVQRSEITPVIYDYRDIKIEYLNRMFLKRNTYYKKIEKQRTLFEVEGDQDLSIARKETIIERQIKVSVAKLDFQYGSVCFRYSLTEISGETEFDIENQNIRPEFEVLKSYFEKFLKSKTIAVKICVVINDGTIVAQSADSADINKFNQELIESVRFQFTQKMFLGKHKLTISKADEESSDTGNKNLLYKSGEELLSDVLAKGKYLHQQQLIYLSDLHESGTLKIRFVLSPFAFVFLLVGEKQYHVILETLDTEEATYIWHIPKATSSLKDALPIIEKHLNMIRTEGRQLFLRSDPQNFSRIAHDYSDKRRGFIIWKDLLEERLV